MCRKTDIMRDIILAAETIKREALHAGLANNRVVYDECVYIVDMAQTLINEEGL